MCVCLCVLIDFIASDLSFDGTNVEAVLRGHRQCVDQVAPGSNGPREALCTWKGVVRRQAQCDSGVATFTATCLFIFISSIFI